MQKNKRILTILGVLALTIFSAVINVSARAVIETEVVSGKIVSYNNNALKLSNGEVYIPVPSIANQGNFLNGDVVTLRYYTSGEDTKYYVEIVHGRNRLKEEKPPKPGRKKANS